MYKFEANLSDVFFFLKQVQCITFALNCKPLIQNLRDVFNYRKSLRPFSNLLEHLLSMHVIVRAAASCNRAQERGLP